MDVQLLKSQFVLNNIKICDVAKKIGISKSAMYRKMKGETEFTREEINTLITILKLDIKTAMKIFFGE